MMSRRILSDEPDQTYDGDWEQQPSSVRRKSLKQDESSAASLSVSSYLASFSSATETTHNSATHAAIMAIQMSTMQASFAEKTADEMRQIVDWYAKDGDEDLLVKISQARSLPDNPFGACLDDEDHLNPPPPPTSYLSLHDSLTPQRTNVTTSRNCATTQNREDPYYLKPMNLFTPRTDELTNQLSLISADADADVHCHKEDRLPELASSPTAMGSPESMRSWPSPSSEMTNLHSPNKNNNHHHRSISQEAQTQHEEVQHLLEATQYMAEIVHKFDHSSSASDPMIEEDVNASPAARVTTRRRHRRLRPPSPCIIPHIHIQRPSTTTTPSARRTRHERDPAFPKSISRNSQRTWGWFILVLLEVGVAALLMGAIIATSTSSGSSKQFSHPPPMKEQPVALSKTSSEEEDSSERTSFLSFLEIRGNDDPDTLQCPLGRDADDSHQRPELSAEHSDPSKKTTAAQ